MEFLICWIVSGLIGYVLTLIAYRKMVGETYFVFNLIGIVLGPVNIFLGILFMMDKDK